MLTTVALMVCLALSASRAAPSVRCVVRVNLDQHWSMDCSSLNATDFKASKTIDPVHNLTLSKNNIEHPRLTNWPDLRYLDLSVNSIVNLTDDVFCCSKHLVHLNVSHNRLEVIGPNAFAKLTLLRSLDLSGNRLLGGRRYNNWAAIKIPLTNHLRQLYMSSTGLESIPADTFEYTRALRTLDLSRNSLKDLPVFPGTLVNLDLSYNLLEVVPAQPFLRCRALESLSLDNNTRLEAIEDGAFHSLVRLAVVSLKGCTNLEVPHEAMFENGEMKNLSCELQPHFGSVLFKLDTVEIKADLLDCNRSVKWFWEPTTVGSPDNAGSVIGAMMNQKMVRYGLVVVSLMGLCAFCVSLGLTYSMNKRRRALNHHSRGEKDPLYESTHDLPPQHPNAIYVSTVIKK